VTHVCQGRIAGWQAAEVGPSLSPTAAEDTLDLGERLDPVRTLLRRSASGDRAAAAALVDVLGPRVHGLALHLLGSARRAESLTVSVLRSCLRDAGQLAASGLPGDVAVLDRARRTATATRPTGDVPSLAEMGDAEDRTTDRRELAVLRVLLALSPAERALVEGAAQGRFAAADRPRAALVLARALDELVPFGPVANAELRGLASLDALGLALPGEQERLRTVTGSAEAAAVHRHAIEAAARLTVLTAVAPSRDLRGPVLDGFAAPAPLAPSAQSAPSAPAADGQGGPGGQGGPEASYRGDYATPVLGTDSQRRMVGPPVLPGGLPRTPTTGEIPLPTAGTGAAGSGASASSTSATSMSSAPTADPAPAFAFRPADERRSSRRERRRARRAAAPVGRRERWLTRGLLALGLVAVLLLSLALIDSRHRLAEAEAFSEAWAEHSVAEDAKVVRGASDNGLWQAVLSPEGVVLRAEGVVVPDGEVLELWAESDGAPRSLGVLEVDKDGTITFLGRGNAERLLVTREISPGADSGSPSPKVVATLSPAR